MQQALTKSPAIQGQKYDGDIDRYNNFVNQNISGISAKPTNLFIGPSDGRITLPCSSIDTIPGMSDDFNAFLVPKKTNGDYRLDLIIYATSKSEDKFCAKADSLGLASVEFGYDRLTAIRNALVADYSGIIDITTMPTRKDEPQGNRDDKQGLRLYLRRENWNKLHFYYDTNFDHGHAFIIHLPKDPYDCIPQLKALLKTLSRIR